MNCIRRTQHNITLQYSTRVLRREEGEDNTVYYCTVVGLRMDFQLSGPGGECEEEARSAKGSKMLGTSWHDSFANERFQNEFESRVKLS